MTLKTNLASLKTCDSIPLRKSLIIDVISIILLLVYIGPHQVSALNKEHYE